MPAQGKPKWRTRQGGLTLIELMVAAVILGVVTAGVVTMLGSGRDVEKKSYIRRQARQMAFSVLEEDAYRYPNYLAMATSSRTVLLDSNGLNISAPLSILVSSPEDTLIWPDPAFPSWKIPYKKVRVQVTWTFNGVTDSVVAQKRVAESK